MSQQGEEGEHNKGNMAVSYASGIPATRTQTLPSFRELLPPHLHEEIDSASYYSQCRQYQQPERPPPPDSLLKPRSVPGPPFSSPPKPALGPGVQELPLPSPSVEDSLKRGHESLQIPPSSGSSTPVPVGGARSPFNTRGPSPILPPIRDLQSLPERNLNRPRSAYDDMATVRPRGLTQEFGGAGRDAFGPRSLEGDRFTSQPYAGSSGTPVPYNQPPYDHARYVHYPASYTSETEYSSMMHSPPTSNFGVLGDPIDSRGKRRRGNLPKPVTDILRQWFHEHLDHPYPSEEDKQMFMSRTGLSISQVGSRNLFADWSGY
ncbi:Homeobox transcription factor [Rasamsonia emersonii CBS 393.64]|uniref:Homeobox transcription factor n=1 Tax=Rasamsonia emersonii (strain ATCC 16479 / CBS 393.64 / IMI 116815) TaxID=1408163 RepID=A0A0F4YXJ6_RASE3|nr:Homeobox transcription factor [Rasamsonia emersonii CBS 393.64]KKA22571.1 Homeobox transcription factor [Rasamsonia emersonii CBS 393.64]